MVHVSELMFINCDECLQTFLVLICSTCYVRCPPTQCIAVSKRTSKLVLQQLPGFGILQHLTSQHHSSPCAKQLL